MNQGENKAGTTDAKQEWGDFTDDEDDHQEIEENRPNQERSGSPQNRPYSNNRGGGGFRGGRGRRGRGGRQRDGGDERRRPLENQNVDEMLSNIKDNKNPDIYLNLFNISYDATLQDISDFYQGIDFELEEIQKGAYLAIFKSPEEAVKLIQTGTGEIKGRKFFMRIGFPNKQKDRMNKEWHNENKKLNYDLPQKQDRRPYQNRNNDYNRKEEGPESYGYQEDDGSDDFEANPFSSRGNRRGGRGGFGGGRGGRRGGRGGRGGRDYNQDRDQFRRDHEGPETEQIDTNNKFFAGREKQGVPRFTNTGKSNQTAPKEDPAHTTEEAKDENPVTQPKKLNPFGDAKPVERKTDVAPQEEKKTVEVASPKKVTSQRGENDDEEGEWTSTRKHDDKQQRGERSERGGGRGGRGGRGGFFRGKEGERGGYKNQNKEFKQYTEKEQPTVEKPVTNQDTQVGKAPIKDSKEQPQKKQDTKKKAAKSNVFDAFNS